MKLKFVFFLLLTLGWNTISAQPTDMQNKNTAQVWEHLQKNDSLFYAIVNREISEENIELIKENPDKFIPPVVFATAQYIFQNEDKEEAVFLYYTALLRAMNDAHQEKKLFDKNKHTVFIYTQIFGRSIAEYTFSNLAVTEQQVRDAGEEVKETPSHYNSAWIYFDGAEYRQVIADLQNEEKDSIEQEKQRKLIVSNFENNLENFLEGKLLDQFKYE